MKVRTRNFLIITKVKLHLTSSSTDGAVCLIGILNKAIEHFAAKSSNRAASSPAKATLAFDATDINANKRIDKDG